MYDLNKINPMYQFSLRVRIDLQITALCSPGHNYPHPTPPSPSPPPRTVKVCCWTPLREFNVKFHNTVHRQCHRPPVTPLNIQLWRRRYKTVSTSSLKTWGGPESTEPLSHTIKLWEFAEQRICALCVFYLIKCMWYVRRSSDSPFTFSSTPEDLLKVEGR